MTNLDALKQTAASELATAINLNNPPDHLDFPADNLLEFVSALAQYANQLHLHQNTHPPAPNLPAGNRLRRQQPPQTPDPPT